LPEGRFITFEGGEGAGKSTQVERMRQRLKARRIDVVTTREPGGSPRAERIRQSLLSGEVKRFGPFAEALLFLSLSLRLEWEWHSRLGACWFGGDRDAIRTDKSWCR